MKLKVGSDEPQRDIRRASLIREIAGEQATIMLDANQKWSLGEAISIGHSGMIPTGSKSPCIRMMYWLMQSWPAIVTDAIALGEHVSHAVLFKNFMQSKAMQFCQVDCTRVGE